MHWKFLLKMIVRGRKVMVVAVVDGGDDRDGDSELLVATDGGKWLVATMAEDWWLAIGFGWIEDGLNGNWWLTIGGCND